MAEHFPCNSLALVIRIDSEIVDKKAIGFGDEIKHCNRLAFNHCQINRMFNHVCSMI